MLYKAFISYSHAADGELAPALQAALHRFTKPWYRLRAMRVFRDDTGLGLTPALWPEIERALNESEHFLLLASPQAAQSRWVTQEVDHWLRHRSSNTLHIIWTQGNIKWKQGASDFDWTETDALPSRLEKAFKQEPLYLDFRWARTSTDLSLRNPEFLNAIATVAAPLHGKSKDELTGEDIRQFRKTRQMVRLAVGTLLTTCLFAIVEARLASKRESDARQSLSRSEFEKAEEFISQSHPQEALAYLARAIRDDPNATAPGRRALFLLQQLRWYVPEYPHIPLDAQLRDIWLGVNNHVKLLILRNSYLEIIDEHGTRVGSPLMPPKSAERCDIASSGDTLVFTDRTGSVTYWDISSSHYISEPSEIAESRMRQNALKSRFPDGSDLNSSVEWLECFTPDGNLRISAGGGSSEFTHYGQIDIERTNAFDSATIIDREDPVDDLCLSPAGDVFLTGSRVDLDLWQTDGTHLLSFPPDRTNEYRIRLHISPDGKALYANSWCWRQVGTRAIPHFVPEANADSAQSNVEARPRDTNRKAKIQFEIRESSAEGGDLFVRASDRDAWCQLQFPVQVQDVEEHPDGRRLLVGGRWGTVQLWDGATRAPISQAIHLKNEFVSLSFIGNGSLFVSQANDGAVGAGSYRVWDTDSLMPLSETIFGNDITFGDTEESVLGGFALDHDGFLHLWASGENEDSNKTELAFFVPAEPEAPSWFSDFLEAVGGMRIGDGNALEFVALEKRNSDLLRIRKLPRGGSSDSWISFAQWFLTDGESRTITPWSSENIRQYVDKRLGSHSVRLLMQAAYVCPSDPRIFEELSEVFSHENQEKADELAHHAQDLRHGLYSPTDKP
jgi:WD40 repeat protein